MEINIFSLFKNSRDQFKNRVALVIDNTEYSYNELFIKSNKIASILTTRKQLQVGIFASRSLPAYSGILGTLASGKTYVPLNPKFPSSRNLAIIKLAEIEIFILDDLGLKQIIVIEEDLKPGAVLICPNIASTEIPKKIKRKFKIIDFKDLEEVSYSYTVVKQNELAYIMFTSGSTGLPKGVPVSHLNVYSYIKYLKERYNVGPEDKFSQTFDLTFDLSVHDLFLSWSVGASLYVIPEKKLMAPAKFVKENKLTVWFSVPSLAQFMNRFRMLKENSLPELRYSLFCGEPLPKTIASAWQSAASNSILENIYGPTEATIGITHYRIPNDPTKILQLNGIVSIGTVFNTQNYCLIDEHGNKVDDIGELCLAGSQVTSGYWNNPLKTEESYFQFSDNEKLWYKTGDIVKRDGDNLLYKSRKDFQVKIRGYRIELEEINFTIKDITKCDVVRTLPHPVVDGVADNLYSFVSNVCKVDKIEIINYLRNRLPEYMVPKDIYFIDEFPLNTNGKIDINQLAKKIPYGK